ncbi:uncharacterized protein B0J16DRAFT_401944 [Fusarium flagelliforme]|uniref:uncharacterized protein n=1 Tax=Fusarium flagelliforme TaxID=2675880 RepID=UPI001E8E887E|nr:uncharacterized protein B0J16DRAFT_401944 [Fusarium flagelliforme]KAH7183524.1 hypothetical protein B0J16DRAFT_401944 [Fusarium flagelliforme]
MIKTFCFCAICGAPTGRLEWDSSSADTYSPDLVEQSTVDWAINLHDFEHVDGRQFRPKDERYMFNPDGSLNTIDAFSPINGKPVIIAFHKTCREVLNQVASPVKVDPQLLFKTLESHCTKEHGFVRSLDYHYGVGGCSTSEVTSKIRIARLQNGGYWKTKKGSEYAVLSPDDIANVDKLINKAIGLAWATSIGRELKGQDVISGMQELSLENFSYWKNKLYQDVPWVIKFLSNAFKLSPHDIHWETFYESFKGLQVALPMGNGAFQALQNRSRIWGVCVRIMEEYAPLREIQLNGLDSLFLLSVMAERSGRKGQDFLGYKWSYANFVTAFSNIANSKPCITIHWSEKKQFSLVGLGVQASDTSQGVVMGSHNEGTPVTEQTFTIPKGSWLREVIVYTAYIPSANKSIFNPFIKGLKFVLTNGQSTQLGKCHGYHPEVYRPPAGFFIAGISAKGVPFERIQFHCQPFAKAPPKSHARLSEGLEKPYEDPPELQPFQNVEATSEGIGLEPEWPSKASKTVIQRLNLGSCLDDIQRIISFGVDAHLGAFELNFVQSCERKTMIIGPRRNAMKYLTFQGDNNRDDYIICCWVSLQDDMPIGLRFVTRKGRQLVAGKSGACEKRYPEGKDLERGAPVERLLCGVFAQWSGTDSQNPIMTAFGVVTAGGLPDSCVVEDVVPANCMDVNLPLGHEMDSRFDSTYPPMYVPDLYGDEDGNYTIHGRMKSTTKVHDRNGQKHSFKRTVSYLDLSGRITAIHPSFAHRQRSNQIPLVGMEVYRDERDNRYHDRLMRTGSANTSFGPTSFDRDLRCDCVSSFPRVFRSNHRRDTEHYSTSGWAVERKEIRTLRMWISANNILTCIQFVDEDHNESPRWGWYKEIDLELVGVHKLPEPEGLEAGLMLVLDSNQSPSVHDDLVVVGIRPVGFSAPVRRLNTDCRKLNPEYAKWQRLQRLRLI